MNAYMQTGFPNADGSMTWSEPRYADFDTKANIKRRRKQSGNWDSMHYVEIEGGFESDAIAGSSDIRSRIVWVES